MPEEILDGMQPCDKITPTRQEVMAMRLSENLRVRLSEDDMDRAESLADDRDITVSDLVRDLIREASLGDSQRRYEHSSGKESAYR
jgi:hypothetical protein